MRPPAPAPVRPAAAGVGMLDNVLGLAAAIVAILALVRVLML
jgi:hypothetical protein